MVFASTIAFTFLQICFWWSYYVQTKTISQHLIKNVGAGVSVVICARNEADALLTNLPAILTQDHPKFEVIVVDHGSDDKTSFLLEDLKVTYTNLRVIHCPYIKAGKRGPLDLGIRNSLYPNILVTDADCYPISKNWISLMTAPLLDDFELVLGAAPLKGSNSLLTAFCKLQSAITYLQYFSAARKGRTFMGVGRNMAYRRESYLRVFKEHDQYIGGDDDLFVNQLDSDGITLVSHPDAYMYSAAPKQWLSLLRQKRRHVSVSWSYSWSQKIMLTLFAASHWGHLAAVLLLLILYQSFFLGFLMLTLRWLLCSMTLWSRAERFIQGSTLPFLLLSDVFYLIYYPFVALFLLIKPPRKW